MQEYKNIILKNTTTPRGFSPKSHGRKTTKYPTRDRNTHADFINSLLKPSFDNDYKQKEENFSASKCQVFILSFLVPQNMI